MFLVAVLSILYTVYGESCIKNDISFNWKYTVSGDMTAHEVDALVDTIESESVSQRNATADDGVMVPVEFNEKTLEIIQEGRKMDDNVKFNRFWYERIPISNHGYFSTCVVPWGVSRCNFNTELHNYGIPVREAEFWYQRFGPYGNGYIKGVRLTYFDGTSQHYGDLSGNREGRYIFALGETLNTLQYNVVQIGDWNRHCCERFIGICIRDCWWETYVIGYIGWTTSRGTFSIGNGANNYKTYLFDNDARHKMLGGLVIAPRERGRYTGSGHHDPDQYNESPLTFSGLGFYLFDSVSTVDIEDVQYIGLDDYTQGLIPKNLVQWIVCNDGPGQITESREYTSQTGSEQCWGEEQSQMYGVDVSIEASVPKLDFGSIGGGAKWELTETATWDKCESTVETIADKTEAVFDEFTYTVVNIQQYQSTITIPYTAKLMLGTEHNGRQEIITLQGEYGGIYVSNKIINRRQIDRCNCTDIVCPN